MRTLLQRTIIDKEPNLYPIWLMRQAGRYMPEYMAVKKASKGFLDMALILSKPVTSQCNLSKHLIWMPLLYFLTY